MAWLQLLDDCGFNGILADEMGLGKTVQALVWLDWSRRTGRARGPALVICPTSLMENWRNEARRFVPGLKTLIVHGLKRTELHAAVPTQDLVITSYALLRRDSRRYRELEFDAVILDEAQHVKNPSPENSRACKLLPAARRLILTGTPMENALHELWSLFDFVLPGHLGTRLEFQHRYEDENAAGGATAARQELIQRIRPFVLRRLKAEVCQELPPKQEQILYCEMDRPQARLYASLLLAGRGIVQSAKAEGWARHRFQALALLTRLRQVCCHPNLLPDALRAVSVASDPSGVRAKAGAWWVPSRAGGRPGGGNWSFQGSDNGEGGALARGAGAVAGGGVVAGGVLPREQPCAVAAPVLAGPGTAANRGRGVRLFAGGGGGGAGVGADAAAAGRGHALEP